MIGGSQRTPPRFVPTLTAVVEVDEPLAQVEAAPAAPAEPTKATTPAEPHASPAAQVAVPPQFEVEAFRFEEQLLHRVLQRIDLSLEERLTDAVSAAVQHQLDAMLPQLRAEIEQVLRALVVEALALELSENPGSAPTPGPQTFG